MEQYGGEQDLKSQMIHVLEEKVSNYERALSKAYIPGGPF